MFLIISWWGGTGRINIRILEIWMIEKAEQDLLI